MGKTRTRKEKKIKKQSFEGKKVALILVLIAEFCLKINWVVLQGDESSVTWGIPAGCHKRNS